MFENVGRKIKGLAWTIFWLATIICCVIGIIKLCANRNSVGWIILILGPVACWLAVLLLYGFGQLIEDTHAIREKLYEGDRIKKKKKEYIESDD